jgi:hypothetical protein
MSDRLMTVTTDNLRVYDAKNKGMDEATANADVKDRNDRAEKMGLSTRYTTAPFAALDKE